MVCYVGHSFLLVNIQITETVVFVFYYRYRCWDETMGEDLQAILKTDGSSEGKDMDRSGHSVGGGLNRSGHGMNRSGHGRSLGFRASNRGGGTGADGTMSNKRAGAGKRSQWAEMLTPTILADNAPTK